MSEENPFTQTHRAFFDMLVAWPPLKTGNYKIKAGNWVSFLSDRDNTRPKTTPTQDADFREIRVLCTGMLPHLQRTSNSSSCLRRYEIQLSTSKQAADASLYPVEWEIYRALSTWQAVLSALTWNGNPFVKLCRPMDVNNSLDISELNRGTPGWSAVWACEAEMFFRTIDLQNPAL